MNRLTQKEYKATYNEFNVYYLGVIRIRKGDNIEDIINKEHSLLLQENIFNNINLYRKATSSTHIAFNKGDKMYTLDKNIFVMYNIENKFLNFMYKTTRFDTKI